MTQAQTMLELDQVARLINPDLYIEYDLLVKQGAIAENGKPWAEVVFGTKIASLRERAAGIISFIRATTAAALDRPMLEQLKASIDTRINNLLCETKPDFDDSIVGINEAWDVVRKTCNEYIDRATTAAAQPVAAVEIARTALQQIESTSSTRASAIARDALTALAALPAPQTDGVREALIKKLASHEMPPMPKIEDPITNRAAAAMFLLSTAERDLIVSVLSGADK